MSGPRPARRLAGGAVTVLLLWLPALVAGVRIDAPPRPGERARIERALRAGDGQDEAPSAPLQLFYAAAVPADADGRAPGAVLARARLASVVGLVGIAGLLYLLLALTRWRSTGVLACAALAALPPVWADGAVLRPEVPAALFGGLAILLLGGLPLLLGARAPSTWLSRLATMLVSGAAIGLAAACVSRQAVLLLVPGGCLLLIVGGLALRVPRLLRRLPWPRLPLPAVQRRVFPWLLLSVVSVAVVWAMLRWSVRGDPRRLLPTPSEAGLLPPGLWGWPLAALGALGALRLALGAGLRASRRARVTPDAVLLIYATVLLFQQLLGAPGTDGLTAAPALALLIAEGAGFALALWAGSIAARRTAAG